MQDSEEAQITAHANEKREYMKSLKNNISKLAEDSNLGAYGVFEKIRDVIPEHMLDNSKNQIVDLALQSPNQFIDVEYPPTMDNL